MSDRSDKILYIDMDNVLVDFRSGIARLPDEVVTRFGDDLDEVADIFSLMEPMDGAVEAFNWTQVLSSRVWRLPLRAPPVFGLTPM